MELAPSWSHVYVQGPVSITDKDKDTLYYEIFQIPIQDKRRSNGPCSTCILRWEREWKYKVGSRWRLDHVHLKKAPTPQLEKPSSKFSFAPGFFTSSLATWTGTKLHKLFLSQYQKMSMKTSITLWESDLATQIKSLCSNPFIQSFHFWESIPRKEY